MYGVTGQSVSGGGGTRCGGCGGCHDTLCPPDHSAAQRPAVLHPPGLGEHHDAGKLLCPLAIGSFQRNALDYIIPPIR